jgi:type I restriction enzyme, S subunit
MKIAIRRWKGLHSWTEGNANLVESSHPLAFLDDLLSPREESLSFKGNLNGWTPITIHFDGSVERRERQTPFKGAMFAAYPGDVVYSKIDVRNGAICLIPPALPQVVLTSEFPVHVPDDKQVDPLFLTFILRTPEFLRTLKQAASGTSGRKRVSAEAFRSIQIPCPDVPDQRRLMKVYSAELGRAVDLERRSVEVKQAAQRDFETALGIEPPDDLPRKRYQLTSFSAIDRWSHEAILARSIQAMSPSEFSLMSLGDVIFDLENGWSPRCENRPAEEDEWGVLKLGAVSFGTYNENENKCLPARLKPKPQHEIRAGDVLISRANICASSARVRLSTVRALA